ncbi:hypothetical protein, partial [Chloroflexus aurantiacus]
PFCGETQRRLQTTFRRVIPPCLRRRVQRVLGGDRPPGRPRRTPTLNAGQPPPTGREPALVHPLHARTPRR